MRTYELVKMVMQGVVLVREDGEVVGEEVTDPISVYTIDQALAYFKALRGEIESRNAEATVTPAPNRAARRSNSRARARP